MKSFVGKLVEPPGRGLFFEMDGRMFAVRARTENDPGDKDNDAKNDEEEKPDRALDDELLDLGSDSLKLYGIDNIKYAEGGSVFPGGFAIESAVGKDKTTIGVFFVGVDFFVGE